MKNLLIKLTGLYLNILAWITPEKAGLKGFQLFCRPFRVPINEKQKEFFNTADKFTLNHEEEIVQGYKWGRGPKNIIFFHGWQSHSYRWKLYIEALPHDEYTLYAIDAPGHGNSPGNFLSVPVYSDLIHRFINSLGKVDAVVAHSLGCFSLLYTFYRFPLLNVNKAVLLACPGEAGDFIRGFKEALQLSNRAFDKVVDHFRKVYDLTPDYFSAAKFAHSINIKGLIIHDTQDNEAPYKYAELIQKAWKRSSLITTTGCGHNLRSTQVLDYVLEFVNESADELASVEGRRL